MPPTVHRHLTWRSRTTPQMGAIRMTTPRENWSTVSPSEGFGSMWVIYDDHLTE